ncbi:MAG: HAD hydrolase family protein [Butyricicoccus pullicaecorum]|nr:HAD hydrolase family protein [Butyricicoccus pullicaecorum]
MIHLIASDIDGTLLQGGQTRLDPALFDVIERLEQHGIRFAAASGRQYTNLRRSRTKSTISAKTAVWSSATAVCCISR